MLTTWKKVTESALIAGLNIALPTADVYSDGDYIIRHFRGFPYHPDCQGDHFSINHTCLQGIADEELQYERHPVWASMVLIPFLITYLTTWTVWYRIDKRKHLTWIACLINLYPQFKAANVIYHLWRNPRKGVAKKRKFEREVSEMEVFLEAVPVTYILTYQLMTTTIFAVAGSEGQDWEKAGKAVRAIFGPDGLGSPTATTTTTWTPPKEMHFFLATYGTSMITASLGMAKALKVGPCKVLGVGGLLSGYLSKRFLLLFFACFFTLVGKAIFFVIIFHWAIADGKGTGNNFVIIPTVAFLASTAPGMINAVFFSWHRGIFKTFLTHPSLLLLPTFTCFTFKSNAKISALDLDEYQGSQEELEIRFSSKATLFNIVFTVAGMTTNALIMSQFFSGCPANTTCSRAILFMSASPVYLLGVLLTVIFLCTTRSSPSCCSAPSCCCCSCSPAVEFGVFKPSQPLDRFTLHYDTYGSKKIKMILPVKDTDIELED